jgi:hypothetical protein
VASGLPGKWALEVSKRHETPPSAPGRARVHGGTAQTRSDAPSPCPVAALVAALARAAAASADAGDLVRVRSLLADAAQAIPAAPGPAPVRLIATADP